MKRKLVLGLLFAAILSAAVVAEGVFYVRRRVSVARLRTTGGLLVDRVMLSVHWQNLELEEKFLPLIRNLDERLRTQRYDLRFISPDKNIEKEQPNSALEWQVLKCFVERESVEGAKQGRPEYLEGPVTENHEYQYFRAIRAERNCTLMCHTPGAKALTGGPEISPFGRAAPGDQKWKEGDLMAVVRITIPLPLDDIPLPLDEW